MKKEIILQNIVIQHDEVPNTLIVYIEKYGKVSGFVAYIKLRARYYFYDNDKKQWNTYSDKLDYEFRPYLLYMLESYKQHLTNIEYGLIEERLQKFVTQKYKEENLRASNGDGNARYYQLKRYEKNNIRVVNDK